MLMDFHRKRRQQFLGEPYFLLALKDCDDGIDNIESIIKDAVLRGDLDYASDRTSFQALLRFDRLTLRYTAGEPIEPLRIELEHVVANYERYGGQLWTYKNDRNETVFTFVSLDEYCQLMQLIGLCFLLHRRDLLPRLAALQDGVSAVGRRGEGNGGTDWLYEEFMATGLGAETRFESDQLCCGKPYEALADAMSSENNDDALRDLNHFLKRWYKDLAGTGWHDSHKPNEDGDQGGYYGYWSFEAGAAVLLLGIEDDSSLHQYLYYPKDLVAWAKSHAALSDPQEKTTIRLRAMAAELCPRAGYWFTPARVNSRRHFAAGEAMPDVGGDYGVTVWQWDDSQQAVSFDR